MSLEVRLKPAEKRELRKLTRGATPARIAKRARVLLCLHERRTVSEVADRVGCGTATVKRVRRNFLDEGWKRAVSDGPRAGRPRALNPAETQELIALACTAPPDGHARWTVSLLTEHFPYEVGRATVHRVLAEDGLKPWREKNVVRADD